MLRDVLLQIQAAAVKNMPPAGLSSVTPSPGATGTVGLSGAALGTFYGLLQVLTTGPAGAATAKLSLDAVPQMDANFQQPFTIPAGTYGVPLEQLGSQPFSLKSGLSLNFSGTFTKDDTYTFTVSAAPDFRVGEEHLPEQDRIFPAVVFVPVSEDFVGTEDFGGAQNQYNSPRAVAMGENVIEAHCWGLDYDRTEFLKNQIIYGIRAGVPSPARVLGGRWTLDGNAQNRTGREYVLNFAVKIPVLQIDANTTVPVQPPFTATITPRVQSP